MKKLLMKKTWMFWVAVLTALVLVTGCGGPAEVKEDAAQEAAETSVVESDGEQETDSSEETDMIEGSEDPVDQEAEMEGEDGLTAGVFTYTIAHDGQEYVNLIHFYDNGVFYYSKYNNGQYQAGYYSVDNTPFEIASLGPISGEGEERMVSCESKITFYDLDGTTVVGEAGYNEGGDVVGMTLQDGKDFVQDLATSHTSEDEIGVNMAEFFIEGDDYSLVAIKHNGTFQDTIGALIAGVWTKDGDIYQLTDDMSGTTYTLTDNGDATALYKGLDDVETTLYAKTEAALQLTLAGTLEEAAYGPLKVEIGCYDDGSAKMTIQYAGTEQLTDGTWVMAQDYSNITLDLGGTEYVAPMDFDSQTFSLEFMTNDGAADVTVMLDQEQ